MHRILNWVVSFVLGLGPLSVGGAEVTRQSIRLQGLHAYADRESVPAGEVIRFHVSSEAPYRFRVTKLGLEVDDRSSDETIHLSEQVFPARVQPIHPGSYIEVGKGLPADSDLKEVTFECWVRPWNLKSWQGILTQHDYPKRCGVGLFLNGSGQAVFSLGDGGEYDRNAMIAGPKLKLRKWAHLAGTWDGRVARLWVDGKAVAEWEAPKDSKPRRPGDAPLLIGAYNDRGVTGHFLDGDIASPAIYSRALGEDEIVDRYSTRGLKPPRGEGLLAWWPLNEEKGSRVADRSPHSRTGGIVNRGTWMIGGPSFDGAQVPRYGDYDPTKDPKRGHALRLASDDLYDCGWDISHEYRVPEDAPSGIHAAWFEFELGGIEHRYPVTFIVRKAKTAKKAPLAVLCATTTWRAYGGSPFAKNVPRDDRYWPTRGQTNDPANPPAFCMYGDHRNGQPAYKVGLRMPWPVAGPDVRYSQPEVDYSHLMRGERFTHVWLEKQGYDFDVYTSVDLHRDPDLLKGYRALIVNGHDEYWSIAMYEGLDRYLREGGSVAVLSGNTMFWRVSFDEDLSVMECRKYGPGIGGRKFASVGEIWHSHDGLRGSLMRNAGYPSWKVIGLDCSGWWGGANNGVYTPVQTNHFLFREPESIDFGDRGTFGHAPEGFRRAGGHEGDIRLSSFAAPLEAVPEGGVFPEEPKGIQTVANIERDNARALDYFARFGKVDKATLVDMIYWERPEGGKVFHAGAIGFGWTLDVDPKQSRLMRNVLFHLAGLKARTPYDPDWKAPVKTTTSTSTEPGNDPREISPENDHSIVLPAEAAWLSGDSVKINPQQHALAWWKTTKDRARWKIRNAKPGQYTVVLEWAAPDSCAGQEFRIEVDNKASVLKGKVVSTGGWGKYLLKSFGEITLKQADCELTFAPAAKVKAEDLLDLRRIILLPEGSPKVRKYLQAQAPEPRLEFGPRKTLPGNEPKAVPPGQDGTLTLAPGMASIHGEQMTLRLPGHAISGWRGPSDAAVWALKGIAGGRYDIHAEWAMPDVVRNRMQSARLSLDGRRLHVAPIRTTGGADRFASYIIGTVELPAGDHRLAFGPDGPVRSTWMRLRSVKLVPADAGEFRVPPLTVREGFEIVPAAVPPLLKHPMMACLDDRGRMFIAESAGINAKAPELLEKRPHKILMLEDADDDGVYDKSSVFAENLVLPNGAQWHDGALYVCSPPYVWRFEDTDDDGRADKQTAVNGKFGFNGMSSAFHGPVLGPDGRLYWSGGQHGWTLGDTTDGFDLKGPWTSRAPGAFSSWPDGTDTEDLAHGGRANPVEVTFTKEGEVLGTVAVYDNVNGRHDALLHWVWGAKYNLNPSRGTDLPQTSYPLLPPVSRRGWVAPAGVTRYRGGAFGEAFRDNIFLCEFNTHRVYRLVLERNGAGFTSRDEIFLESSSPYSHFTDVFEDADGSLLVVDTGGWFLYGCPTSSIEKPEVRGAIYRIRKTGAPPVDDPRGGKIAWRDRNPEQLAALLEDSRFKVRDRAIARLASMKDAALPALEGALDNASESARRNAVWALARIHTPRARDLTRRALKDESFSVRLTATRSISTHRDAGAVDLLKKQVIEAEPAVRRESATALGRMGDVSVVPALLEAMKSSEGDRFLQHAIKYALIELNDAGQTSKGLASASPEVQRASLIALDQMRGGNLSAEQITPLLASPVAALRDRAIEVATRRKWIGPIREHLSEKLIGAVEPPMALRDVLLSFRNDPGIHGIVDQALSAPETSVAARAFLLETIARAELKKLPAAWREAVVAALDSGKEPLILAALSAAEAHGVSGIDPRLETLAGDSSPHRSVRVAAARVLGPRNDALAGPLFDLLLSEYESSASVRERLDLAGTLARCRLTARQESRLIPLIGSAGPLELETLLKAIQNRHRKETGRLLFAALKGAPGYGALPTERIEALKSRVATDARHWADELLEERRARLAQKDSRLAELEAATRNGVADRGMAAYKKAACIVCHKVNGEGGIVGPELTDIGSIRTRRDLLEAIAFPNATFAREFEPWQIELDNGDLLICRIAREDETEITLVDAANIERTVPRSRIKSQKPSTVSLMPAGLDQALTQQELADLIAFLRSLK